MELRFQGHFRPAKLGTRLKSQHQSKSVFRRGPGQKRGFVPVKAVSKSDLDELEMHIAIANQEMSLAAREDRFKEAAEHRDRLENLRLRQRCLQIEHTAVLRASICHHLGQIVKHRRYNYRGVIFGVHPTCQAKENWIQTMGVDRLPNGRFQPFYQVLVDSRDRPGGVITYVAQENISILDDQQDDSPIRHNLLGELFEKFDKTVQRYVPLARLIEQYPDSLEAQEQSKDANSEA